MKNRWAESISFKQEITRIIMLYKGLKVWKLQPVYLRMTLSPKLGMSDVRNHHSLAFQTPFANTDIYKCSFFSQTIRDWNSLTDTLLSAAEGAEDCC